MEKNKYIKITFGYSAVVTEADALDFIRELDAEDIGLKFIIEVLYLTADEFNNLPDFEGF